MNTFTIEKLSHEGRGISHFPMDDTKNAGKVVLIRGALPGEVIEVDKLKSHRRFAEGQASVIHQASPDRVIPHCKHTDICGGCSLMHLNPQKALEYHTTWVLEQLAHFGHVTPEIIAPPLTGDNFAYRRRARLGVKWVEKKQKLLIGFREANGRYLADLDACEVLIPEVGQHFDALRQMLLKLSCYQAIPQIEISAADQGVALVIRHLEALTAEDLNIITDFAKMHHFIIFLQSKGPDSIQACYPLPSPTLTYTLSDFDLSLAFKPGDFLQINAKVNQAMVQQAIDWLDLKPTDNVLDLFCGLGNFTLPIATRAQSVTGVEGDAAMVTQAKTNALLNKLENTTFYEANLFEPTNDLPWMSKQYDKILLDPPRAGAEALIPYIAKLGAKTLVYVSCHPASLARDLGLLQQHGYKLKKLGLMDMFTHTAHVEVMALLTKF